MPRFPCSDVILPINMSSLLKNAVTAALLLGASLAEAQETTAATTSTIAISSSPSTACATVLAPSYSPPVVADGWKAQLVATGLTRPRGIKFDINNGLLVVEAGVGLTRLTFTDNGGTCLSVKSSTSVIADKEVSFDSNLPPSHNMDTNPNTSLTTAWSSPRTARPSTSHRTRTCTATATTPTPPPSGTGQP